MKQLKFKSTPYIIKNKNYSTITFKMIFPCEYEKEHLFDNDLIKQIILNSSYKYRTEKEFKLEKIKRLVTNLSGGYEVYHNNLFFIFTLTIPNPKKIKDYDINAALEFFHDVIYEPNVINNEFNNQQFEREKEYIRFSIQCSLKKIYTYGYQRFLNIIDDKGDLKYNIYNNLELIEQSNPKDLYEYYKKIIMNNKPICFIYGDVDKESISNLYSNYFNIDNTDITFTKDYYSYLIPSNKVNYIDENSKYSQSILYMGYKIKEMNDNDQKYLELLANILNSRDTNLIFKKLRTEKNLIYSYNYDCYVKKGLFTIIAYIDSKNKELTISAINELMDSLNNKDFIIECVNKIVKGIEYALIEAKDSKYYLLDKSINSKFEFSTLLEEIYEFYKEFNYEKFAEFIIKIKLDTVFFLRGGNNEEK